MPEITRPLYVQYTGNNTRQGCCECIAFGQLEGLGPTINQDKFGIVYKLGYCQGINCKEECYFVLNTKSKEYVLHKDQEGNWCGLIAPENYLCFEANITIIKTNLRFASYNLVSLQENIKKAEEILNNPVDYDNFVFDYFKFFGPNKNAKESIGTINAFISNMEDELKKPKVIKNQNYYLEVQKNIDNYKKILQTYRRESLTPDSDFNKLIKDFNERVEQVKNAQDLLRAFATTLALLKSEIVRDEKILRDCAFEATKELLERYERYQGLINTRNK